MQDLIDAGTVPVAVMSQLRTGFVDRLIADGSRGIMYADLNPCNLTIGDAGEIRIISPVADAPYDEAAVVARYGLLLQTVVSALPVRFSALQRIAGRCLRGDYGSMSEVALALEKESSNGIYATVIAVILIMGALLLALATN